MSDAIYTGGDDPIDITRFVLDRSAAAMLAGQFDIFFEHVHLPHETQSFEGSAVIETREEFADLFRQVHSHYRKLGVTDLVRADLKAEFLETGEIIASYQTRFLRNGTQVHDPSYALVQMSCIDGVWKTTRQAYAFEDGGTFKYLLGGKPVASDPSQTGESGGK